MLVLVVPAAGCTMLVQYVRPALCLPMQDHMEAYL